MELIVKGQNIRFKNGYVSLTDIAKTTGRKSSDLIRSWLRNRKTLLYLEAWEEHHSKDFKSGEFAAFKLSTMDDANEISIRKYIDQVKPIGVFAEAGRYGGTYAHIEIAFEFATYINPTFKIFFFKEWVRMKEAEINTQGIDFFLQKSISNADEIGNLLREIKAIRERNKLSNDKKD